MICICTHAELLHLAGVGTCLAAGCDCMRFDAEPLGQLDDGSRLLCPTDEHLPEVMTCFGCGRVFKRFDRHDFGGCVADRMRRE